MPTAHLYGDVRVHSALQRTDKSLNVTDVQEGLVAPDGKDRARPRCSVVTLQQVGSSEKDTEERGCLSVQERSLLFL